MKVEDYLLDMEIQIDELEIECLEQPKLMIKYSSMLSEARQRRDLKKEEIDLIRSTLDKKIREDPDTYGLDKVTESAVVNAIIRQEKYQRHTREYHSLNHDFNVLQGVVQAVEQRKSMIEGLIKLNGQQYFAGPSVPRDINEIHEHQQQRTNKGIGQKLKRSKQ